MGIEPHLVKKMVNIDNEDLPTYLQDYIEAAGLADDREGALFRTSYRRTGVLTDRRMTQSDAWRMLQRRARDAGIPTAVCNHTFRATGITAYLDNGGSLENAQAMAAHESPPHYQALRPHGRPDNARRGREDWNLDQDGGNSR
jgi:integrase